MLRSLLVSFETHGSRQRWAAEALFPLLALLFVMAACGASTTSAPSAPARYAPPGGVASTSIAGTGSSGPTLPNGTPVNAYLIRSLEVSLQVAKPLDAEHQITQDILAVDTQAQAAGEEVDQQDDGSYTVALTFAVSAAKYDTVKSYLSSFGASYPALKAVLLHEKESVENVTSQYVDLQSRLTNLRTEQTRLLQLLSQAQDLSDTLTIQDKLTDVEGQIEQIEGQINQLDSQTGYSMVTINLSAPSSGSATTSAAASQPWNPGGVFGSAAGAMLAALQVVVTILIWLLVFAVFWGPVAAGWYFWRRMKRRQAAISASNPAKPQ